MGNKEKIEEKVEKKKEEENKKNKENSIGCFNFYELDNLKKNGFLNENNTLTIKCEVKPENYEFFEDSISLFFFKKENNNNRGSFLLFNN